jgi:rubrerythrin
MGLDPMLKKEINKVIPHGAKAGEIFKVPNRGIIEITEAISDSKVNYTFYDEPNDVERLTKLATKKLAEEAANVKAASTVTVPNVLNTSQALQTQKDTSQSNRFKNLQEKNMVDDLEPTAVDTVKYEKIQKEKQFRENVNNAINIASELKGDIKKIKEELCEGPDCLKNQVQSKFSEIDAKIAKLDERSEVFVCEKCGYPKVPGLSSYCPQCGAKIPSWNTDDGEPIPGWVPYWELHKEE